MKCFSFYDLALPFCLLCVGCVATAKEQENPDSHETIASISPDGRRVAYVQWDNPMVRIVVVNLERPDRTVYVNLGKDWDRAVTIFWPSSLNIEIRERDSVLGRFSADPQPQGAVAEQPSVFSSGSKVSNEDVIAKVRQKLPHRSIKLLQTDKAGNHFLLVAEAGKGGKRIFVYVWDSELLFEVSHGSIHPN